MKTLCTILVLAAMWTMGSAAMAASGGSGASADHTIVYNRLVSKSYYQDGKGNLRHEWNLTFPHIESVPSSDGHSHWKHSSIFGPDNIYIGFAGLVADGFDIKPGGCWEWGFSLMRFATWSPSNRFGIKSSLYLTRTSYRIKGDDAFHIDDMGRTVCDDALKQGASPLNYRRQRLIHWSWRVPVEMYVRMRGGVRYSVGIEGELRHHVRSRARVGHKKKYYIDRNNLDVNPFGWNLLAGFGTDGYMVFGRYNLTDFFGDKSLVDAQPFTVGINFRL